MTEHKILVANRGELAIRIMRACRKLGVAFTAVYTAEDAASGHVRLAREEGGEKSLFRVSSYHDANELMAVADEAGCTAVHPGYGFFAEDFRFARRVTKRDRKLTFIGPSWKIIRELGEQDQYQAPGPQSGRAHGAWFGPPHLRRDGGRAHRQVGL